MRHSLLLHVLYLVRHLILYELLLFNFLLHYHFLGVEDFMEEVGNFVFELFRLLLVTHPVHFINDGHQLAFDHLFIVLPTLLIVEVVPEHRDQVVYFFLFWADLPHHGLGREDPCPYVLWVLG